MKRKLLGTFCAVLFAMPVAAAELAINATDQKAVTLSVGWEGQKVTGLAVSSFTADKIAVLLLRGEDGTATPLTISLREGRVMIGVGGAPGPGPIIPPDDPDDPDIPDPEVPDGHRELTKKAYDWVHETIELDEDPDRGRHARELGAIYLSVAAGLAAIPPEYKDIQTGYDALAPLSQKVLPEGPIRDAWQAWFGRIVPELTEDWNFPRAEAAKRLEAIGNGLKVVK